MTDFAAWLDEEFEKLYRDDDIGARPPKMSKSLPGADGAVRAFQVEGREDENQGLERAASKQAGLARVIEVSTEVRVAEELGEQTCILFRVNEILIY